MTEQFLGSRVAVITGAASGLGREYAVRFAREGARLILADIVPSRLEPGATSALEELRDRIALDGGKAVIHYGDIGQERTADDLIELALDSFGELDVVVNNAGNWYEGELIDSDVEEWDSVHRTHLRGAFLTTRAAGRHWRRQGSAQAAIVNTSSRSAFNAIPTHGAYAAAKAGVATLTQIAAKELRAHGVRVNCVVPAARTPMATQVTGMRAQLADQRDAGAFDELDPANVAPLVAYLSSRACPFSGQVLFCRGGTVEIYAPWSSRSAMSRDGAWTVAELADQLPGIVADLSCEEAE
ncbi:hypothetical protein ASC77_23755 [Nocardioides sp. Root1257]|uniref:SDR family oxidoreductase n=1 Tax=unclassified Nocardioides TaxID=2615069 RepID=UPI0007012B08|nr:MULTISPECIES: SDR family oxidoreductase [unclassified Nocardioides]KQW42677.1 hypothetical protein ASC77_23755 [Nocardioides sp. Root1257]KRC39935.1 hypothetical protein ASE24_23550 [Nocardioides sp. Root224]